MSQATPLYRLCLVDPATPGVPTQQKVMEEKAMPDGSGHPTQQKVLEEMKHVIKEAMSRSLSVFSSYFLSSLEIHVLPSG